MTTTQSSYQLQAENFLQSTQTSFSVKYLRTGKYFDEDKEDRDIYEIELIKGGRSYKFKFGNSINNSGKFHIIIAGKIRAMFQDDKEARKFVMSNKIGASIGDLKLNKNFSAPTPYDVFACVQKYDVGTFENFCSEFGYDTDSKKAEKTYNAVRDEYLNISRLYNEQELEQMSEIQ